MSTASKIKKLYLESPKTVEESSYRRAAVLRDYVTDACKEAAKRGIGFIVWGLSMEATPKILGPILAKMLRQEDDLTLENGFLVELGDFEVIHGVKNYSIKVSWDLTKETE